MNNAAAETVRFLHRDTFFHIDNGAGGGSHAVSTGASGHSVSISGSARHGIRTIRAGWAISGFHFRGSTGRGIRVVCLAGSAAGYDARAMSSGTIGQKRTTVAVAADGADAGAFRAHIHRDARTAELRLRDWQIQRFYALPEHRRVPQSSRCKASINEGLRLVVAWHLLRLRFWLLLFTAFGNSGSRTDICHVIVLVMTGFDHRLHLIGHVLLLLATTPQQQSAEERAAASTAVFALAGGVSFVICGNVVVDGATATR